LAIIILLTNNAWVNWGLHSPR